MVKKTIGERYGRLIVVKDAWSIKSNGKRIRNAICKCDCGIEKQIALTSLRSGKTKSCGCLMREQAGKVNRSHGMSTTREYSVWRNMLRRTGDSTNKAYKYYGERGISVCDRWKKFENFYEDMGKSNGLTIDRIDVNGNYEPKNCRWASWEEQRLNKRSH